MLLRRAAIGTAFSAAFGVASCAFELPDPAAPAAPDGSGAPSDAGTGDRSASDVKDAATDAVDAIVDAIDGVPDAVDTPDASDGAADGIDADQDPGPYCGPRAHCVQGATECCITGPRDEPSYHCIAPGSACLNGSRVACDEGADCATGICCADSVKLFDPYVATCASSCSDAGQHRLCHLDAQPDECASLGRACAPLAGLPGYAECR